MVKAIEAGQMQARERALQADINRRKEFLFANRPTQQKIVGILKVMNSLIEEKDQWDAQTYFFRQIKRHLKDSDHIDNHNVDWEEVRTQILWSCFSDSDMEGFTIVPRRVESEFTVFRSLMKLPRLVREDF